MRRILGIAAAACVLAACSGGGDDPAPPPTGSLQLVNGTTSLIHEVYVAWSTDSTWGAQQNSTPIASAGTFTLNGLDPGLWNLMAVSVGTYSDYYGFGWDLPVTAGLTTSVTAYNSNFSGTVKVSNAEYTNYRSIVNLYVAPVTWEAWGDDQLFGYELPTGYTYELQVVPPGDYDVRCVFSNGFSEYAYSIPVSSFAVTSVTCDGI